MGLRQGSAPSTMRIVILNVIASVKQHSCKVVQVGQEALCSHRLQKMHSDNKGHWARQKPIVHMTLTVSTFPQKTRKILKYSPSIFHYLALVSLHISKSEHRKIVSEMFGPVSHFSSHTMHNIGLLNFLNELPPLAVFKDEDSGWITFKSEHLYTGTQLSSILRDRKTPGVESR